MSAETSTNVVVHPRTGEVLDLRAISADTLLEARDLLYDGEREVREMRRPVDDEIVRRLDHEGRRSVSFTEFSVSVNAPLEKDWNAPELRTVLLRLAAEGLISHEKADACVKYEPKVVWGEVKTLLTDPRVRERIEACFEEVEARRYVKVTRRG